jgi:hypothetical protein
VAADATRAYSTNKLKRFVRQIVYLRPDTFVIFDDVAATKPEFKKTWLLQAMKKPEARGDQLIVSTGRGKLFVQPLLPVEREIALVDGENLCRMGSQDFPPRKSTGPAPECRIQISPSRASARDFFLHVLATGAPDQAAAPQATAQVEQDQVRVKIGGAQISFSKGILGGEIEKGGQKRKLSTSVQAE